MATIGCGLLTLSTVTATIALFGLVGWSIARSWVLWPLWLRLLRHPLMLLVLAFFMWSALSLTWSTNPVEGFEILRAQRYLLLIPSLVPVLGAVRWLLLGVLAGVMVQTIAQVLVFSGLARDLDEYRQVRANGGLSKQSGPTSAWAVIAMGIAFSTGLGLSLWARVAAGLVFFGGVFMTASRSALLAMAFTMFSPMVFLRSSRRWMWSGVCGLAVVSIGAILFMSAGVMSAGGTAERFRTGADQFLQLVTTGVPGDSSIGTRWVLYRAGFQVGLDHPLAGVGLGAARETVKDQPTFVAFMNRRRKTHMDNWTGDLHGGWAESFAELGIPGFLLFIVPVFMALAMAVRHARSKVPPEHAWGPAVLAAVLTWLVFGMFTVVYSSGQLEAMAMFAVTLAIGAGAGLFATGTGMQRHAKVPHEDNT